MEQNGKLKRYRDREDEILFMDLRQMGSPYEKKYIELTEEDRAKVTSVYHNWQQEGYEETYENVPEFCYSASFDEVKEKDLLLYRADILSLSTVMRTSTLIQNEVIAGRTQRTSCSRGKSKSDLLAVFKELGYEIEL